MNCIKKLTVPDVGNVRAPLQVFGNGVKIDKEAREEEHRYGCDWTHEGCHLWNKIAVFNEINWLNEISFQQILTRVLSRFSIALLYHCHSHNGQFKKKDQNSLHPTQNSKQADPQMSQ